MKRLKKDCILNDLNKDTCSGCYNCSSIGKHPKNTHWDNFRIMQYYCHIQKRMVKAKHTCEKYYSAVPF